MTDFWDLSFLKRQELFLGEPDPFRDRLPPMLLIHLRIFHFFNTAKVFFRVENAMSASIILVANG